MSFLGAAPFWARIEQHLERSYGWPADFSRQLFHPFERCLRLFLRPSSAKGRLEMPAPLYRVWRAAYAQPEYKALCLTLAGGGLCVPLIPYSSRTRSTRVRRRRRLARIYAARYGGASVGIVVRAAYAQQNKKRKREQ